MDSYRELAERMKGLSSNRSTFLYQGIVRSVQGLTCTVEIDSLYIEDVRLRASTTEQEEELLIIPSIGSVVVLGSLSGDLTQLVVLSVDKVDSIKISGGKQGGLVLVDELTSRLNAIERDINMLKKNVALWQPATGDGGASLKLLLSKWSSQKMKETHSTDLSNQKIKQ